MARIRNTTQILALTLVLVLFLSCAGLMIVEPASAQIITSSPSSPSVNIPMFSVKYIPSTYYSTTNTTNPFTGENVETTNYYTNNSIELSILNQAFNPDALENGSTLSLLYSVQAKPHFNNYPFSINMPALMPASSSQYTTIDLGFSGDNSTDTPVEYSIQTPPIPNGGQIDIQVEATMGFYSTVPYHPFGDPSITMGTTQQFFETANSGWSNYLTIKITDEPSSTSISSTSPYPTLSPTITSNPTSSIPEFSSIATSLLMIIPLAAIVAKHMKNQQSKSRNFD